MSSNWWEVAPLAGQTAPQANWWEEAPLAETPRGPQSRGHIQSPGRAERRAELEQQLQSDVAAADAAGERLNRLRPLEEPTRVAGQVLTAPARGVLGLPALAEQAVLNPINYFAGTNLRGPMTATTDMLNPERLAPQGWREELAGRVGEGLGAALTGLGAGQQLARGGSGVAQRVGQALEDMPGRQLAAAGTSAIGGQVGSEYGPVWDFLGTLLGGAAPFLGAPPPSRTLAPRATEAAPATMPIQPTTPAPAANAVEVARAAGFKVLPSQAEKSAGSAATRGGRAMQLIAPAGDLTLDTARHNAQNAARVAARDLGLPEGQTLSQGALRQAMDQAGAAKEAVAQQLPRFELSPELASAIDNAPPVFLEQNPRILALRSRAASAEGSMSTSDALREAQRLRDHGFANRRSETPETVDLGRAQLQMADAIENAIEDQAARSGMTDSNLMLNFRNARQQQAKIANVMEAGVQQGEEFLLDPQALAKFDAQNPNVLTGGLKVIADTARDFPETMKIPTDVASKPGGDLSRSNIWNLPGQLITRTIGQIAAPIIRSDFYQNMLGRQATRMGPGGELGRFYPPPREPRPQPLPPQGPTPGSGPVPGAPRPGPEGPMLEANRLAGDLGLLPEGPQMDFPPAPSRLTADIPPPPTGGLPFTPSQPLAATLATDLGIAPPPTGGLPGGAVPRAAGMSENVQGTRMFPELRAVRSGRDVVNPPELTLDGDIRIPAEPDGLPLSSVAPEQPPIRLFGEPELPLGPGDALAQALVPEPQSRVRLPRSPDFPLTGVPPETPIAPRPAPDALSRALTPEPDAPAVARAFRGEPPWTSEPPPAPPEAPVAPAAPPRKPPGGGSGGAAVVPEGPQGRPFQTTGYRGVGPGRDPLSTEGTLGNALFWAPDEFGPTGAARYAEGGGQVLRQDLNFQNMLGDPETSTLASLAEALGVDPQAALENLIEAARGQGFDALAYNLRPGAEFVQIPPRGVTGPTSNGPR